MKNLTDPNFEYNDLARATADYMLEQLYDTALWQLDRTVDLEGDEYNELHAEFMKQVLIMMLQD
tara:strand:+ start:1374 stop:1565 length:192 start_codon:yes stop_codon:yes gene_type:complete